MAQFNWDFWGFRGYWEYPLPIAPIAPIALKDLREFREFKEVREHFLFPASAYREASARLAMTEKPQFTLRK